MKRIVNIVDEENNEGKYEIFCSFDSEITGKSYVIFTEYTESPSGTLLMKAGSYKEENDKLYVNTKLTAEENEMISNVLNTIINQATKNDKK